MNIWNGLKNQLYTGIVATLVTSLSILGACAPVPATPQPAPTNNSTQPAPQPSVPQPVQKYNVKGTAFHDYNGNGIKNEGEPIIAGLGMELIDENGSNFPIKTDVNGVYEITLPTGTYELKIDNKSALGYNNQPYRYFSKSKEDCYSLETTRPIHVEVEPDSPLNVALMQGFLTLPFDESVSVVIKDYFDLEPATGKLSIRDWQGGSDTYDGHPGTDFKMNNNTPIIATAPGTVINTYFDGKTGGNVIEIHHGYSSSTTLYAHLNEIRVKNGDRVNRGDLIGLSGNTGAKCGPIPHLHFGILCLAYVACDPYRDVNDPDSINFWTVDNNPQYP